VQRTFKGEINMRRLVVISNSTKKSKAIATLVVTAFLLTSIHLAASARIETLKQQQEQFEQASIRTARAFLKQSSLATSDHKLQNAAASRIQPENPAANSQISIAQTSNAQDKEISSSSAAGMAASRNRQIVISIADRELAVLDNDQVLKIYPIAVGANVSPSPDGEFVIINHAKDPIYRHADKEIAPGKDNPLGSRWMGLSLKGYGIHGTNVQSSVGNPVSHGCFRMRKHDVEELYGLMQVGDKVTVRREHDAMIAQVFAAPATAPAATNVLAAKTQRGSEVQVASATETATVETTEQ
jgi:lipoprotein-anchoring transpeptidase ErfK/SrfK